MDYDEDLADAAPRDEDELMTEEDESPHGELVAAVASNDLLQARALLSPPSGLDVNQRDEEGATVLSVAAFFGFAGLVLELIRRGAELDVANETHGWTPLIAAASRGHLTAAAVLLAHGASAGVKDLYGLNALAYAEQNGHHEVAALLKAVAERGEAAIPADLVEEAANDVRAAEEAGASGADDDDGDHEGADGTAGGGEDGLAEAVANAAGDYPDPLVGEGNVIGFLIACSEGQIEMVQEAIENRFVDVDCCDADGSTGAHASAATGQSSVLAFLCENGADVNIANKTFGWTPLIAAAAFGSVQSIATLLKHGADFSVGE